MPGPLIDCYVISPNRTSSAVTSFLNHFVSNHAASFHRHNPAEVLGLPLELSLEAILDFLEKNVDREYAFYWRNMDDTEPYHAMAVFCKDASLILGLSPTIDVHEGVAKDYLNRMKKFVATDTGYCAVEYAPPSSRQEFYDDWKMWKDYCS